MKPFVRQIIMVIGISLCASIVWAMDNWQVLKTDHFEIFYKPGYENKAKEILKVLEIYRTNVIKLTGHEISKLRVVVEDCGSMPGGYADPINPRIGIITYPPSSFLSAEENWFRLVGVHELIHMAHFTKTGGFPKGLTTIFGNIFLPNLWSPGWIVEGITTYGESQSTPYEGRLNEGFYEAVMLSLAAEKRFPSLLDITYTPLDFPSLAGGIYLYGGGFFNYLKERYGENRFAEFFDLQGRSLLAYPGILFPWIGIDRIAKKVYDKPFKQLWNEYQRYCEAKAQVWKIDGTPLTLDRLSFYSYLIHHKNLLYYIKTEARKTGPNQVYGFNKIIQHDLRSQKKKEVVRTTSYFSAPPQIVNNSLYYAVNEYKRGYANTSFNTFGLISNLHRKDLSTGEDKILLSEQLRAYCVLEDGRLLYSKDRLDGFGSELWLFMPGTQPATKELILKTDYLVDQMVVDKKRIIFTARQDWDNWGLYLFDLDTRSIEMLPLINTPYAETQPSIMGDKVIFAANYDKIYRIYAYDLTTNKLYQLTEGSFAYFPTVNSETGELYFVGISSLGSNIYHQKIDFAREITPIEYPQSDKPDLAKVESEVTFKKGNYGDVLQSLVPAIRLPTAHSAYLIGSDVTGEHFYAVNFKYGQDPQIGLTYRNTSFAPLTTELKFKAKQGEKQKFSIFGKYPVYKSLEPGLSELQPFVGIRVEEEEGNSCKEAVLGLGTQLTYPKWLLGGKLQYIAERKGWNSDINRDGWELGLKLHHYLPFSVRKAEWGSEISLTSYLVSDPDNPRGVKLGESIIKRGGQFLIEYSFPILKVRKGLWNPNIYIEDISLIPFSTLIFGEGISPKYESGFSVAPEIKVSLLNHFLRLSGGVVFSEANKPEFGVTLSVKVGNKIKTGMSSSIGALPQ